MAGSATPRGRGALLRSGGRDRLPRMETLKRTATCGELTKSRVGESVILNGWVHRNRDHGGITFIDLRDRYGITQVVVDADAGTATKSVAAELGYEYCIAVEGVVRPRPQGMVNPSMLTGEIEVAARGLTVLSRCAVLPFMVDERSDAKEDLRLKYRYLDLRSFAMQKKIRLRHEVVWRMREYLSGRGFYEIETPTFIRSTPEGARDFLVPSRTMRGSFYALPQSPQLYKQILMVSGMDRYFQMARCYRDEDARGDRQPEFTQLDLEMSFVSKEDVFEVIEGLLRHVFREVLGKELAVPFTRLSYDEAMESYGSDKPDLRFGMKLQDFSAAARAGGFDAFRKVLDEKGAVKALVAPGCATYSRTQIAELEETARTYGAKGLAWMKVTDRGLDGGVSKFYQGGSAEIVASLGARPGDLILAVGGPWKKTCTSLGAVRLKLGRDLGLCDPARLEFCWIIDFPLFEWNEEERKWDPAHHMFTMPQERFIADLEKDPGAVKGDLYDLVCNGTELASGSIRIHDPELQKRVFRVVGIPDDEAERRFGFLLEVFRYGPPPHGGIAPGIDRLVMILAGETTIREVIAFPKNTAGVSPMDNCPAPVDEKQLRELGVRIVED